MSPPSLLRTLLITATCLAGASPALGIDTIDLAQTPATPVLSWAAPENGPGNVGNGASAIGDFNGDGQRDYVVDKNNNGVASILVVFGPADGEAAEDLIGGGQGFTITDSDPTRNAQERFIANLGDLNGDGRDDMFVPTTSVTATAESFIVYGRDSGDLDLASFSTADGVRIRHTNPNNPIYLQAARVGDANGDGVTDLAFSSFSSEPKGNQSGSAWVVFGSSTGWPALIDLDALGSGGYRMDGSRISARFGYSLAAAGDVNGDGRDDIALSAPQARGTNLGSIYVIYGKANSTTIDTATLGGAGMRVDGPGRLGGDDPRSVTGIGDLNGDGLDDIAFTCLSCSTGAVVLGSASNATVDIAQIGSRGWTISGDYGSLSRPHRLGDVNGDGRGDVGFASPDWSTGPQPGSYLVVTNADFGDGYDLYDDSLDGRAFLIRGSFNYAFLGLSAYGVPDVTGDGVRDILLTITDSGSSLSPAHLVTVSGAGLATAPEDLEPPTISAEVDPSPNAAGWNNTPVTVDFSCDDETQLVFCSPSSTLSDEGAEQIITGTAEDAAGNTASIDAVVSIDLTPPQIVCPATPEYAVDQETILVGTVTDELSGALSSSATATPDTSAAGSFTVQLNAEDLAGNTAVATCSYTVTATGFAITSLFSAANVSLPPTINTAKAGRTIPLQWTLHDENGQPVSDPASFVSITSGVTQCGAADPADAVETAIANGGLQYQGDGAWRFNWKTSNSFAGECRVMRLNLAGGQTGGFAIFQFT